MADADAEAEPSAAVVTAAKPIKRGRGRPRLYTRDEHNNPIRKKIAKTLDTSVESADESFTPVSGVRPRRATRGKVPIRYKDTVLIENEVEKEGEEEEGPVVSVQKGRGRGRPPKYLDRPPSPENNGNPDVTVNIAVKDKNCAQHLDLMGVYILYYCRKCAFSSKQMADITEHIKSGEHLQQPIEALEGVVMEDQTVETFVSEPLVSEALTDVAQEDLQTIVAKDKIVKTGGKYVKVDEHSYAEVTVEKPENTSVPTAKGDAPSISEETVEATEVVETENVETENGPKKDDDAGELSDDSVADPDYDGGDAKDDEEEAASDHELDSDGETEQPKKRGRKRKYSDPESVSIMDENFEENSDLEDDPMVPRRYTCPQCPYAVLYSFNDFKEHRRCHKNAVDVSLHCYVCQLAGKKRVMTGETWGRIKTHLSAIHNVDFQLPCPLCSVQLSQHTLFVRHYKSHLNSCKYDFCRYDTAIEDDMRLHTKCHLETNPRHFRCPLCNFTSKLKPWKWPIMHYHLVTKHGGAVKANFTCKRCSAGFFDTNTYIDHKNTCGKDEFTKCDLCHEDIPKASLVRHAVWHVRKDEGLIPPDEKFEFKTNPKSDEFMEDGNSQLDDVDSQEPQVPGDDLTDQTNDATDVPETSSEPTQPESPSEEETTSGADAKLESQSQQTADDTDTSKTQDTSESQKESSNADDGQEIWQCVEHEETFDSQAALTQHYLLVHWGLSEQRVSAARREAELRMKDQANRLFPSEEDNAVMRQVEQMRRMSRSGLNERCQYCYKTFASVPRLLRHLSRCHTDEKLKPMPCTTCNKYFRNRVQLRNHYRVVHEGIKRKKPEVPYQARKHLFICELCGYTTPENIRLKNHHLSAHAGIMPYSCEICQYKTNEKSDLRRHQAKHEGRKRHTCDYCDYKTDQRWLLVNHCMRQHNIQLAKHNRDTRGMTFGSRRKVEQQEQPQIEQVIVEGGDEISLETLGNLVQLQAVQNGEEVTIWMTTPEEYEAATNVKKGPEEVLAVDSLKDAGEAPQVVYITEQEQDKEETEAQQIVYVREDGTIISADELMTIAVEGDEYGQQVEQQSIVVEPQAQTLQVQEVVGATEGEQIIVQEN